MTHITLEGNAVRPWHVMRSRNGRDTSNATLSIGFSFLGEFFTFAAYLIVSPCPNQHFSHEPKGGSDLGLWMDEWICKMCFRHTLERPQTLNKTLDMVEHEEILKTLIETNQSQKRNTI